MPREWTEQLGLWPDASFDGNRTRRFRTPRQQRVDFYSAYLNSVQWQCRRGEVIVQSDFVCNRCGKPGKLQVHHRSYRHLGDELPSDLWAVCVRCHERLTEEEQDRRGC